ncbi:hypothetical protein HO173_012267 [Letharia columbiana]|uniref:Uncharacterized protein n=1 Tax=Letharia columbiana TaxID=112416 RepID=A0A8H6CNN3_9LECA|nr:uncharacterized protein HO173_012267 [Letharia columbiana]KAF6226763.1 hypothetical protein HO173_012267 [Letharia columbiana]
MNVTRISTGSFQSKNAWYRCRGELLVACTLEQNGVRSNTYEELLANNQALQDKNTVLQEQLRVANTENQEQYVWAVCNSTVFQKWTAYWNGIQQLSRAMDLKVRELRRRLAKSQGDLAKERFLHARTMAEVHRLRDERDNARRTARIFPAEPGPDTVAGGSIPDFTLFPGDGSLNEEDFEDFEESVEASPMGKNPHVYGRPDGFFPRL